MVRILSLAVAAVAAVASVQAFPFCPQPTTIDASQFDPVLYQGKWYEIASSPVIYDSFENQCQCVTANYTLLDAATVKVFNTCRQGGPTANTTDIIGNATIPNPSQVALEVNFPSISPIAKFFINLLGPNYFVSKLDPNYQWAVVTFPCDIGAWILSRTPTMDDALYNELYTYILENYPLATIGFRKTVQDNCSY